MSLLYGLPPSEVKYRLTSQDITILSAAYREGLLPDPWVQTGVICSTIANVNRGPQTKPFKPEDFLYRCRQ